MPKEEKAMRALVYSSPGAAEVRDRDRPVPGPGEVLVRSRVVGVCHSDLELLAGRYIIPVSYPIVPGHEWAGEVAETGPGRHGLRGRRPGGGGVRGRAGRPGPLRLLDLRRRRRVLHRPGGVAAQASAEPDVHPGRAGRAVHRRLRGGARRRHRPERPGGGARRRADRAAGRHGRGRPQRERDRHRAAGGPPGQGARRRRVAHRGPVGGRPGRSGAGTHRRRPVRRGHRIGRASGGDGPGAHRRGQPRPDRVRGDRRGHARSRRNSA